MKLIKKQLQKELFKNKIFLILMMLLAIFTSYMYFFVRFSTDANLKMLNVQSFLNDNEKLYEAALQSNVSLAYSFLIGSLAMTSFVYGMFFYRFFKKKGRDLGCLKALGFSDHTLRLCFARFSFFLTLIGSIIGLILGFFTSNILLDAGKRSYEITRQVKGINFSTGIIGLFLPALLFSVVTALCYAVISKQENALLLVPQTDHVKSSRLLGIADRLSKLFPAKKQLSLRLSFRKPIALLLVFTAVMCFSVMFILAYSLNLSSHFIYISQTDGWHYQYDVQFTGIHSLPTLASDKVPYLTTLGKISTPHLSLDQQIISFDGDHKFYELLSKDHEPITYPQKGEIVISPALHELYDLNIGDQITISVKNKSELFTISNIAFNAELNSVYVSNDDLQQLLQLSKDSFNGIWSMSPIFPEENANLISLSERLEDLDRHFVSNRSSAVINQVIGALIGCILLFLALLVHFQDSTRDMLILDLMGYRPPAIRKMLINIYGPVLMIFYTLSLMPSICLVKFILRSLSLQIGDYMPFYTNCWVLLGIFALLYLIYFVTQWIFSLNIKKLVHSDNLYAYTSSI